MQESASQTLTESSKCEWYGGNLSGGHNGGSKSYLPETKELSVNLAEG